MTAPLPLRFVVSALDPATLPEGGVEVAVAGRSNVGKSSLINALANRRGLAQTSKTPGRTRTLNLFEMPDGGRLVDLPGYGFASVSRQVQAGWPEMIEGYLLGRAQLVQVLVVVDGAIGPTRLDTAMLEWLRAHDLAHTVVATKQDKVRSSQRGRRRGELARACGLEPGEVVWVSAVSGAGIDRLRGLTRGWLAAP